MLKEFGIEEKPERCCGAVPDLGSRSNWAKLADLLNLLLVSKGLGRHLSPEVSFSGFGREGCPFPRAHAVARSHPYTGFYPVTPIHTAPGKLGDLTPPQPMGLRDRLVLGPNPPGPPPLSSGKHSFSGSHPVGGGCQGDSQHKAMSSPDGHVCCGDSGFF